MTATFSPETIRLAQHAARHRDGKYGNQPHRESGIIAPPAPPVPTYLIIEGDDESSCVGPYADPATAEHALGTSPLIRRLLDKNAHSCRFMKGTEIIPDGTVAMYDPAVDEEAVA